MKKLVFIYFHPVGGGEITLPDYEQFYLELKENQALKDAGIEIEDRFCPDALVLINTLKALKESKKTDELYFHFSGHGNRKGIPFGDWNLHNSLFANMLEDKKIKFCFFSSCQSADLVQIVNGREIPIVIGTKEQENIENTFAIEFQKEFYKGLANKLSFLQAFKNAYTTQKVKEREENPDPDSGVVVIQRGEGAWEEIEEGQKKVNELQIILAEKEQERCLIYPSILEAYPIIREDPLNAGKEMLVVYALDENLLADFAESFYKKGCNVLACLFLVKAHDLQELAKDARKNGPQFFCQDLKIILLIDSSQSLMGDDFDTAFNNSKFFSDDFYNPPFARVILKNVDSNDVLGLDTPIAKGIVKWPKIEYENLDELMEQNDFLGFIKPSHVNPSEKKGYILKKFPCDPSRKDAKKVKDKKKQYIRLFFAPSRYEKLIYMIINWLRNYHNIATPIIRYEPIGEEKFSFEAALRQGVREYLKETSLSEGDLLFIKIKLIQEGHFIVFHTHAEQVEHLKTEVQKAIQEIISIPSLTTIPKKPTFIFFIIGDDFTYSIPDDLEDFHTKAFHKFISHPEGITQESFEEWIEEISGDNDDFDEFLSSLSQVLIDDYKINFEQAKDHCPSHIIEKVCLEFAIPPKQILDIT